MNRPIKFRAWWKDTLKPIPDFMDEYGLSALNSPGFIVEQFTGLKDQDGVEIYEGDVVKIEYGTGKVIFHHGCFMLEWVDDREANMELLALDKRTGVRQDLRVLGNIHQNPELLK